MLPQFGFAELLFVAVVALIVVGPKDLPVMLRRLGQMVSKGRAVADEFRSAFDDIARQAELDELREEIEDLRRDNAVTAAAKDLQAAEADINAEIMRQSPPQPAADPDAETDGTETESATGKHVGAAEDGNGTRQ